MSDKDSKVDHIDPAGSIKCWDDIGPFIKRLLCEEDGLQVLCRKCHDEKTQQERAQRRSSNCGEVLASEEPSTSDAMHDDLW